MLPVTLSLLNSPDSGGRKMGTTPNGTFYQEPVNLLAAQVALRLITADVSLPATPFSFESARDVFGKLNTHDFLTTALTGSNNDLDFLARTPGAQDITVEYRDPAANNAALSVTVHAYLKTALTGSNNDLVFTAVDEGDSGDAITIAFVDPAANSAAGSVSVVGKAITFHLATGRGGGPTPRAGRRGPCRHEPHSRRHAQTDDRSDGRAHDAQRLRAEDDRDHRVEDVRHRRALRPVALRHRRHKHAGLRGQPRRGLSPVSLTLARRAREWRGAPAVRLRSP